MKRNLERARANLRQAINTSDAPYTSVYIPRTQALALLDAADRALSKPVGAMRCWTRPRRRAMTTQSEGVSLVRCTKVAYHQWHPIRHWFRQHRVCVQCGLRVRL